MNKKNYLDTVIEAKRLTRRVVAERIGTTEQLVSRWASGEVSPSLMFVFRLKKILGRHLKIENLLSKKHFAKQTKWEKTL